MRIGYELLDSRQDAKHQVDYYKLISNKCEWNNCFIKNQTLDKNISNSIFYRFEFSEFSYLDKLQYIGFIP